MLKRFQNWYRTKIEPITKKMTPKRFKVLLALSLVVITTIGVLIVVMLIAGLFNPKRAFGDVDVFWWIVWLGLSALLIFYELWLVFFSKKSKSNSSNRLASSKWMPLNVFERTFKKYLFNDRNFTHGWLLKTELINNNSDIAFYATSEPGHTLVLGPTRTGKSALLVNPQIQALARGSVQASMIISDPKGELFRTHANQLKMLGYEVMSLNLRNDAISNKWNPLSRVWEKWQEANALPAEERIKREDMRYEAKALLSELAAILFPSTTKDLPIWQQGASTVFQFLALGMLEQSGFDKKITFQNFTINNILANLNATTFTELSNYATFLETRARENNYTSLAVNVAGRNIRGAEMTVNGMSQNTISILAVYNDPKVMRVTAETTITLDPSKPQAIFIIVPDEDKSKNDFISLFVAETYKQLIKMADSHGDVGRLPRPFYYILDEFGNIPSIPSLDAMVSVSASRSIFFMFIVQNLKQINEKYSDNVASVIINNCAYQIYLLTNDFSTAEEISRKIGETEIEKTSRSHGTSAKKTSENVSTSSATRRLILPDELMKLKFGEIIVIATRLDPIKSKLAKFYIYKNPFASTEVPKSSIQDAVATSDNPDELKSFDEKHLYRFVITALNSRDEAAEESLEFDMATKKIEKMLKDPMFNALPKPKREKAAKRSMPTVVRIKRGNSRA